MTMWNSVSSLSPHQLQPSRPKSFKNSIVSLQPPRVKTTEELHQLLLAASTPTNTEEFIDVSLTMLTPTVFSHALFARVQTTVRTCTDHARRRDKTSCNSDHDPTIFIHCVVAFEITLWQFADGLAQSDVHAKMKYRTSHEQFLHSWHNCELHCRPERNMCHRLSCFTTPRSGQMSLRTAVQKGIPVWSRIDPRPHRDIRNNLRQSADEQHGRLQVICVHTDIS